MAATDATIAKMDAEKAGHEDSGIDSMLTDTDREFREVVDQYSRRWGPISAGLLRRYSLEVMIKRMRDSLASGVPQPGWDRCTPLSEGRLDNNWCIGREKGE
jgi:hypothetical protein